ncbi:MAG: hypothetical protein AAFR35_15275 [Pseudomonadota bacterium]
MQPAQGTFERVRRVARPTVIQRDGGGEFQDWVDGFREAGEVFDGQGGDQFDQEAFQDAIAETHGELAVEMAKLYWEAVSTLKIEDPWSMLWGAFKAVATFWISSAIEAEKDDYYGTRAFQFDVTSNRIDLVHQMPGKLVQTDDGPIYRLDKMEWQLKGPPVPGGASTWNVLIELDFYVEFYDRVN